MSLARSANSSVLAMTLAFVVVGCTTKQAQRPYPAPTAEMLIAALKARQAAVRSASLGTKTTSWLGGDRVRGTVLMLVDRRGRLRFEAEAPLRGTVATLATDGNQFGLLEAEHTTFKRGPACADNVAQLVRIPLAPEAITAVLLGDAPLGDDARAAEEIAWDPDAAADVVTIDRSGAPRLWIKFRAPTGAAPTAAARVVGIEGEMPGVSGHWRVEYDDFDDVDGRPFPNLIRFAEAGRSFDQGVEIKVRDRTVNPQVADAVFKIDPPADARVVWVPCRGDAPPAP